MLEKTHVCHDTTALPPTIHIVAKQVFPVTFPLLGDGIEPVEHLITVREKWRMRYSNFHIWAQQEYSVTLALRI